MTFFRGYTEEYLIFQILGLGELLVGDQGKCGFVWSFSFSDCWRLFEGWKGDLVSVPINGGVPFFKPGFSKDNVVVGKGHHS